MLRLPHPTVPCFLLLAPFVGAAAPSHVSPHIAAIRFWTFGDVTRVAVQTEGSYKLKFDQVEHPSRLYFDLSGLRPPSTRNHGAETIQVRDRRLKQIRVAQVNPGTTRIVFDLQGPAKVLSTQLVNPDRLMIEIRPKETIRPPLEVIAERSSETAKVAPPPQISTVPRMDSPTPGVSGVINSNTDENRPPSPVANSTANDEARPLRSARASRVALNDRNLVPAAAKRDSVGERSLVRVFGLKLGKVVIDAGHGGHDTGTIGPYGLMEKDLVLDVALRLGQLISQRMGAQVLYTRSDDVFIPLEDRTKIANSEKADLFISIHANSSPEPSATGVETYYFNMTTDQNVLDLATRENATSISSISDLNDLLHKAVLKTKSDESREFAQKVQAALWGTSVSLNRNSRDRGVRQAPFVVLIGATMPSILAEIGFVSNPHDERLLKRTEERQRIAEALFKGVSQYGSSLSHTQIARATAN